MTHTRKCHAVIRRSQVAANRIAVDLSAATANVTPTSGNRE